MNFLDDSSKLEPEPPCEQEGRVERPVASAAPSPTEPLNGPLQGDPISYAGSVAAPRTGALLPEDLRVTWSWPHLITFLIFGFGSLLVIQVGAVILLGANHHLSQKQLQQFIESKPQFLVGTNLAWYALLFLFLYMTLAVLRDLPFWRSLGWKKLAGDPVSDKGSPWMYFLSGSGMAIFVAAASTRVKNVDHVPIQELFKNRNGAILLMCMAVLVAPLVEETIFRGYLYPLFASKFSGAAENFGIAPLKALRIGTAAAIVLTGILFGLMHGAQLGWTWGLVSLLILVGVVFTFARAWTGTVFASFLLHLGYNSMIALTSIIATKGFTHLPTVR